MNQTAASDGTLIAALRDARTRTLALAADLTPERWSIPQLETMNPPLWELGHVGWFSEFWTLRNLYGRDSLLAKSDELYDSAKVAHATRWSLPLPSIDATHDYLARILDELEARFDPADARAAYFVRLITFHEDMHDEATFMTYHTLGYPWPAALAPAPALEAQPELAGDVHLPAGRYTIGATPDLPFVFDNEKWQHAIDVQAYAIAKVPVTNGEFSDFVNDGGYAARRFWSDEGWAWRGANGAAHPRDWRRLEAGAWERRWFAQTRPLRARDPVCNVNWFEASAYARWAGRRLPSEAEWEVAATYDPRSGIQSLKTPALALDPALDAQFDAPLSVDACALGDGAAGCRQMFGNVWEWTATPFAAYPGFVIDPYKEYSAPWFGDHYVLRGGSFVTRARLLRPTFRNFYKPHRRDAFAGFRTCAP